MGECRSVCKEMDIWDWRRVPIISIARPRVCRICCNYRSLIIRSTSKCERCNFAPSSMYYANNYRTSSLNLSIIFAIGPLFILLYALHRTTYGLGDSPQIASVLSNVIICLVLPMIAIKVNGQTSCANNVLEVHNSLLNPLGAYFSLLALVYGIRFAHTTCMAFERLFLH